MLKIMDVKEAQATILRREQALEPEINPAVSAAMIQIFGKPLAPQEAVSRIVADVRQEGDQALRDWTERIDRCWLESFIVPEGEIEEAAQMIPADLKEALELAAERIRSFHACQPVRSWSMESLGGRLGQRVTPIDSVGVYVPGGTAPLPSSLLMAVIPAQVAGVKEIVVATPPGAGGRVSPVILAAAQIAGLKTLYRLGGAQAIAALAFGTETIPRVDKIVGAGNLFVTLAKRQVYGLVGIDGLYGPTETMVIADETANVGWVAADLLAQAEHDLLATAILLTPSRPLAEAVQAEVGRQIESLSRADTIAVSLANQGCIVLTQDLEQAAQLANQFAPEHLCICTADPPSLSESITAAGGIFLGERSFEVLGDYVAGPSHIMPTGQTARFSSPLSVIDFVKYINIIELDDATSTRLSRAARRIAEAEGLTAHAQAAQMRFNGENLPSS